jgi:hypothetical protein
MPDLNFLKSILDYNPANGIFIWKQNRGRLAKAGQIAGTLWVNSKRPDNKYYQIMINAKLYALHRLAYFFVTGVDPLEKQVDHINGNTLDNRFDNLRIATSAQNSKNQKKRKTNKSGFKGVCWHKKGKKWYATIRANNKQIHLGGYNSKFYAALVYARAAKHYFGEWRRLNSQ